MNLFMLFAGLAVLTMAFFAFGHPLMRRLGLLSLVATTFAAGYLLTDNVWAGLAAASVWFLLPWVEILLRVRKLRLPLRKELRSATPPAREMCPDLEALSDEIEAAGFEHTDDLGWEMDGYRQFLRLFARPEQREEAAITCVEQNQMGFHFVSVTSRSGDGSVYTTWNCPVPSSLKTPPKVHLRRAAPDADFGQIMAEHASFLESQGCTREVLQPVDPEAVRASVQMDMVAQMDHNLREGLLQPVGEGHSRYSWRGMLYLWCQFLRDIFRIP